MDYPFGWVPAYSLPGRRTRWQESAMISGIPLDLLFIASVLLIWFMLMYQFVLAFAGYLYSRESDRERRRLDNERPEVSPISVLIPAHNEEIVIERTLDTLLASDYPM